MFGQPQLLDPDALPGAADEGAGDGAGLARLQARFRESAWWGMTPHEIEVPFEMAIDGTLVRGRMDAVYRRPDPDGEGYDVIDWKTGRLPAEAERAAVDVQLAAYRFAWHRLSGAPLQRVSAAFYYVEAGVEVRPADLLDADGLRDLLRAVPLAP